MAGVKVTICGVNTQELPLLSAKEKKELLLKIKAGDQTARERFIKGNLRLVLSIVGRFSNSNENVDDLLEQTKAKTIEFLQEHLEEQSLLFAKKRCQNTINNICNQPTSTIEEYKASLDGVVDIVNPQEEYNKVREELQKIIDDKDYLAALKVINNKGLLPSTNLPNVFGWKKQYYIEYVIRLLESKDSASEELCDIFREYVPVEI